ncbi:uncharacterized protein [Hemitrygon akajei]|uniref:uncharacterized protein n=1 Tax=Hemitrygon akajei TaxID=2704970 RepID=UPI003BF9FB83
MSKSSKSGRKEAMTSSDETMVALGKLRDEILKEFKTAGDFRKSSKPGGKEVMTPSDETLVALGKLRDEILKEFKTAFKQLEDKLDQINDKVDKHAEHLSRIDSTSEDLESCVRYLETLCSSLEGKSNKLLSKMVDLENRSRRCNIRILGLPEANEKGSTVKVFAEFLCELFGKDLLPKPPKLERAHRVYVPPGILGSRPRPVILCFHQYQIE